MSKFRSIVKSECQIQDRFWSRYIELVRGQVIPYQWNILNDRLPDTEPSHAIDNFRIASGERKGEFYGQVFQDSDVYKWLEAVGNILQLNRDSALEEKADSIISIIEKAQCEDGYLNTYFQIMEPEKKWTDLLECHELYCAGHLIESAVAYYKATGKDAIYRIARKLADHIDSVFGPQEDKLHGYPGHQEIELALLRLYDLSGEDRYLKLAKYFLDTRGTNNYFEQEFEKRDRISFWSKSKEEDPNKRYSQFPYTYYNQFHLPVREQTTAVGHAVRGVYMYTAMADLAVRTNDEELLLACNAIWKNITEKQMYITGGIGSSPSGEAFTVDYDLPNDTVYAETCASIGLIFFGQKMLLHEADRKYADVIERALYNLVLAGMSAAGDRFFYVNPLEVIPESCLGNPERNHVKPTRQKWFACACCPPNIARLIGSLWQYLYTADEDTVYIHQYISGDAEISLAEGTLTIHQQTEYPWNGRIELNISSKSSQKTAVELRIPGWCEEWQLQVNNMVSEVQIQENGYLRVEIEPGAEIAVVLELSMTPRLMQSNPKIQYNAGKTAVTRGPLVYCLEEADNGKYLKQNIISSSQFTLQQIEDNRTGTYVELQIKGTRDEEQRVDTEELYYSYQRTQRETELKMIPYFLWNNRGDGEMLVWVRTDF